MKNRTGYMPGPAAGAEVEKDGEKWALVMVRELRHAPATVWRALTDPAQLREWAPFEADRNLSTVGPVKLSTVGAPQPIDSQSTVKVAEAGKRLEHTWVGNDLRWQLEPLGTGTRLTLWIAIDRRFIAWGAAGWHVCFDVLDHLLAGEPIGRIAGPEAMQFEGWQRLSGEYGKQFGVQAPSW